MTATAANEARRTDPVTGIDLERPATIYGIRDRATGETRYVGSSVQYEARKKQPYSAKVTEWLNSVDYEHYVIESTTVEFAVQQEKFHIHRLREAGAPLLNWGMPSRTKSLPVDPYIAAYQERLRGNPRVVAIREDWKGQAESWRLAAETAGMEFHDWMRAALDRAAHTEEPPLSEEIG